MRGGGWAPFSAAASGKMSFPNYAAGATAVTLPYTASNAGFVFVYWNIGNPVGEHVNLGFTINGKVVHYHTTYGYGNQYYNGFTCFFAANDVMNAVANGYTHGGIYTQIFPLWS